MPIAAITHPLNFASERIGESANVDSGFLLVDRLGHRWDRAGRIAR
jgi:hypothetical protein